MKNDPKQEKYFRALKVLDEQPKAIEAAKAQFDADMAGIRQLESKGIYGKVYIDKMKDGAKSKRDNAISKAVDKIRDAYTIAQTERPDADTLDIDDPSLQNALRVIQMGKVSPSVQLSILEKFRGNPAALSYLGDVFKQRGLFYADKAREMTQGINNEAFDNMAYAISSYDAFGTWPSDKLFWTRNEFAKALERFGANPAEDPTVSALKDIVENSGNESAKQAAAQALANRENGGMSEESADTLKTALDTAVAMITEE